MRLRSLIPSSGSSPSSSERRLSGRDPFHALQREMNRLFEEVFEDAAGPSSRSLTNFEAEGFFSPELDVKENDTEIIVKAELPGVEEADISVELLNSTLTIRGEKKFEREEKDEGYYVQERAFGSFQRTIALPSEVDEGKVEASFKKGVLTVTLPKSPEAQRHSKKIEIKTS